MQKSYFNIDAIKEIQERRLALALRKNNDYGGQGDNIALTGAHGLAVRLLDKAMRLYSLTYPGAVQKVEDESIVDTFLDVGNYGDFGVSVMEGTWGARPPAPIVWDLEKTSEEIKKAGGIPPGTIQFNGREISIDSLREIFNHVGRPIGTSPDPKQVRDWGERFEGLAHRAPPAGTKKTSWETVHHFHISAGKPQDLKSLTPFQLSVFGDCPVCDASHGELCRDTITGKPLNSESGDWGDRAHLKRTFVSQEWVQRATIERFTEKRAQIVPLRVKQAQRALKVPPRGHRDLDKITKASTKTPARKRLKGKG